WTKNDAGCFHEQTDAAPLILVLNEDFGLIHDYCEDMVKRSLAEDTINERKSKYYSHIAFHLYQMYLSYRAQMEASAKDPDVINPPDFGDLRSEVNRVGKTLVKLMEVSR